MNYKKHYDELICRAKNRISLVGYTESHHIIPRCMGGSDDAENLIPLTPEEHYVAHQLLIKINPEVKGLVYAAFMMAGGAKTLPGRVSNKPYGWIRRLASIEAKRRNARRIGYHLSEETRLKISSSHKSSEIAIKSRKELFVRQVGRPKSEATKLKISLAKVGKPLSEEHKRLLSIVHTGKTKPREQVEKMAAKLRGRVGTRLGAVTSEETKAKQRDAALRRYAKA